MNPIEELETEEKTTLRCITTYGVEQRETQKGVYKKYIDLLDKKEAIDKYFTEINSKYRYKDIILLARDIVIPDGTSKIFSLITKYEYMKQITKPKTNKYCYEIVRYNQPCKLYFDIEYPLEMGKNAVYAFIEQIKAIFKNIYDEEINDPLIITNQDDNGEMIIKLHKDKDGKITKQEWSYHLIFLTKKRFRNNHEDLKVFILNELNDALLSSFKSVGNQARNLTGMDLTDTMFFDDAVYTRNRQFRLMYQSKIGRENQRLLPLNYKAFKKTYRKNEEIKNIYDYKYNIEMYLIGETNYSGEFYDVDTSIIDTFGSLMNNRRDRTDEEDRKTFSREQIKKEDIITINGVREIILGFDLKKISKSLHIIIAVYCKKNNLKDLYKELDDDLTFWDDLTTSTNIENDEIINGIVSKYNFCGSLKKIGNYHQRNFKQLCPCFSTGKVHNSNTHWLCWTSKYVVEKCIKTGDQRIIYRNISKDNVSLYSLKKYLTLFYKRVKDKSLIKELYGPIQNNYSYVDKRITYETIEERYLGDINKYFNPEWDYSDKNDFDLLYDTEDEDDTNIPEPVEIKQKTLIIQSDLGTGKSYSIYNDKGTGLLNVFQEEYRTILFITPRKSYATSIYNRYKNDGLDVCLYTEGEINVNHCNILIIQLESLFRLNNRNNLNFDIIIMDECESILNQFSSTTITGSNKRDMIFQAFSKMFELSKHIVFMDAFITKRTLMMVKEMRTGEITFLNNTHRRGDITFEEIQYEEKVERKTKDGDIVLKDDEKQELFIRKLKEELKAGKKCYGLITSKSKLLWMLASINEDEDLKHIKYKVYHSEVKEHLKKIENANEEWGDLDLVLTTTSITVGIDFSPEKPYFDCGFLYGTDRSANIRDVLQSLYRIRQFKEKKIWFILDETEKAYYNCEEGLLKQDIAIYKKSLGLFKRAYEVKNNNIEEELNWMDRLRIINKMEANINRAFYREILKYFCESQNYTFISKELDCIKNGSTRDEGPLTYHIPTDYEYSFLKKIEPGYVDKRVIRFFKLRRYADTFKTDEIYEALVSDYCDKYAAAEMWEDLLINPLQSIEDIQKTIITKRIESDKNNTKLKIIRTKRFLNTLLGLNETTYLEFLLSGVELPGSKIKDILGRVNNLKQAKKQLKMINRRLNIKKMKRVRKVVNGKKTDDFFKSTYKILIPYNSVCIDNKNKYEIRYCEEARELFTNTKLDFYTKQRYSIKTFNEVVDEELIETIYNEEKEDELEDKYNNRIAGTSDIYEHLVSDEVAEILKEYEEDTKKSHFNWRNEEEEQKEKMAYLNR